MAQNVSPLVRAHNILLYIAEAEEDASMTDIASDLCVPDPTVHRIIAQLINDGLVMETENRHFRLGWKALQFASRIWNSASEEELALPLMSDLSKITGETVTLNKYMPHEGICVCVAVAETAHSLSYALKIGDTRHLNMGAGGKSILTSLGKEEADAVIARHGLPAATPATVTELSTLRSEMEKIRQEGFARSCGESVAGAIGYAVPVFCRGELVFGSIAVTAPLIRFKQESEAIWICALKEKAHALSELLGAASAPMEAHFSNTQEEEAMS